MTLGKSRQQQKVLILSRFKFKSVVVVVVVGPHYSNSEAVSLINLFEPQV